MSLLSEDVFWRGTTPVLLPGKMQDLASSKRRDSLHTTKIEGNRKLGAMCMVQKNIQAILREQNNMLPEMLDSISTIQTGGRISATNKKKYKNRSCQNTDGKRIFVRDMSRKIYTGKNTTDNLWGRMLAYTGTEKGRKIQIKTQKRSKKRTYDVVYDLEIEDNHNFFVEGFLVHNCDEHDDYVWSCLLAAMALNIDITGWDQISGAGSDDIMHAPIPMGAVPGGQTLRERDQMVLNAWKAEHARESPDDFVDCLTTGDTVVPRRDRDLRIA